MPFARPSSRVLSGFLMLSLVALPAAPAQSLRGYERDLQGVLLDMRQRREQNASMDRMQAAVREIGARLVREGEARDASSSMRRTGERQAVAATTVRRVTPNDVLIQTKAEAARGDAMAQVKLGHIHGTAYAGPKDMTAAYQAYAAAAEQGNVDGQTYRGVFLMTGQGVARDSAAALVWLRRAAAQGDATAQEWVDAYAPAPANLAERAGLYRRAAERGDPVGMMWLGHLHNRGEGVPQSDSLDLFWYTRAAEAGNQRALLNIANRYSAGTRGARRDLPRAHGMYRILADSGNARAMVRVGSDLLAGVGASVDTAQAIVWFRRAADAGDGRGAYELGRVFQEGTSTIRRDFAAARRWFSRGDTLKFALASYSMGVASILGQGAPADTAAALRYFARSADLGLVDGAMDLGSIHETGMLGVKRDGAEAMRWYSMAALNAVRPAEVAAARAKVVALGGDAVALDAAVAAARRAASALAGVP